MAESVMYDIVSLTRCYEREESLEKVLQQSVIDMPKEGISVMNVLILDNVTPGVRTIIDKYSKYDNVIVSEDVEGTDPNSFVRNRLSLNRGLAAFDASGMEAKWTWLHDDDQVLQDRYKTDLKTYLDMQEVLAFNVVSLFIWEETEDPLINLNQFHNSPLISRYIRGHRWPEDGRAICCTKQVQTKIMRNPYRAKTLPLYILDYGASNAAFRQKMYDLQVADGKYDKYVRAWTEEPTLTRLSSILLNDIAPLELASKQMKVKGLMK